MQILDRKLKSVSMMVSQFLYSIFIHVFFLVFPERKEFIFHSTRCFLGICFSHECEKEQLGLIPTTDFTEVIFREKKRVK